MEFSYLGYPCLIIRHLTMGHLCGYAAVPEGHAYYHKPYKYLSRRISVHRGITFARHGHDIEKVKERDMLQYPDFARVFMPSHDDKGRVLWWIGFDCAYMTDKVPGMTNFKTLLANNTDLMERIREMASKLGLTDIDVSDIDMMFGVTVENQEYRNIQYVEDQLRNMVKQIAKANMKVYEGKKEHGQRQGNGESESKED